MRGHSLLWKSGLRGSSEANNTVFHAIFIYKILAGNRQVWGWQMALNNQKDCLFEPIKDLPLSAEFKSLADSLHYKTLDEMLKVKVAVLLKEPGFTFHMMQELVQFLEKRDLANLLKQ